MAVCSRINKLPKLGNKVVKIVYSGQSNDADIHFDNGTSVCVHTWMEDEAKAEIVAKKYEIDTYSAMAEKLAHDPDAKGKIETENYEMPIYDRSEMVTEDGLKKMMPEGYEPKQTGVETKVFTNFVEEL